MFLYFFYYGVRKIVDVWENMREKSKLSDNCEENQSGDDNERRPEGESLLSRITRHCGLYERDEPDMTQQEEEESTSLR